MKGYVGITTGPIFDTIGMAHTPAAMWYASSMFSRLTERICANIVAQKDGGDILSPYYNGTENNDGIGRYHDRVIVKGADTDIIKKVIDDSVDEICAMVLEDLNPQEADKAKEFLKNYFQVSYVCFEKAESDSAAMIKLGGLLDSIEQMKSPNPENTDNPFVKLFKGEESANDLVKNRITQLDGSQLMIDGRMKSIEEIAGAGKKDKFKRYDYFAIVEADGDNIGKLIATLDEKQTTDFSELLFEYAAQAADEIGKYGGMTIYAGGDDLMFLAPVYKDKDNNVFTLCERINALLTNKLKTAFPTSFAALEKEGKAPGVSFGVAIRRKKFPLYEAWHSSMDALYAVKQKEKDKNCLYIDLQKGSGQAIKLELPFAAFVRFNDIFATYNSLDENMFKSLIYNMSLWEKVLEAAKDDKATFDNVMKNMFDNEEQKKLAANVEAIGEKIYNLVSANKEKPIRAFGAKGEVLSDMKAVEAILRISKFMVEKEGQKNEQVSDNA